jgi:ABC-2 type transport system permease protein
MAVYRKTYQRYAGRLTPAWSRVFVIPRYAFEELHRRRFLNVFFLASMLYPLVCAFLIWVNQNLAFLELLPGSPTKGFLEINSGFFLVFLGVQSMAGFFMASFVGPGLVSPDLANNALPLYFSRPINRKQYVLGKMLVLCALLSVMTWIPGLLLWLLHGSLAGDGWLWENLRLAAGLFFGAWIWILVLSLMALALSAWVKWKPAAGGLLFGVFFVAAGFGGAVNAVLRTKWGHLMNISHLVGSVWVSLFEEPMKRGAGAVFFRVAAGEEIPIWCCWAALIGICMACLWLLAKKIRGAEVVRS